MLEAEPNDENVREISAQLVHPLLIGVLICLSSAVWKRPSMKGSCPTYRTITTLSKLMCQAVASSIFFWYTVSDNLLDPCFWFQSRRSLVGWSEVYLLTAHSLCWVEECGSLGYSALQHSRSHVPVSLWGADRDPRRILCISTTPVFSYYRILSFSGDCYHHLAWDLTKIKDVGGDFLCSVWGLVMKCPTWSNLMTILDWWPGRLVSW